MLDFGAHVIREGEKEVFGEWHLWLYMCHWCINWTEAMLVGSDDEREIIKKRARTAPLGEVFVKSKSSYPALDLALTFDSGFEHPYVFKASSVRDNQWII